MGNLRRLGSVRSRAALGAALATLVVVGLAALWMRSQVRDQWADASLAKARQDLATVAGQLRSGLTAVSADASFSIRDSAGVERMGSGPFAVEQGILPRAAEGSDQVSVVRFGGRDVPIVRTAVTTDGGERFDVYVLASPENARVAVATVDRTFALVLPLSVLFVGLVAWLVTGRALRPVEAIRARMAEISAGAPEQRVPVPPSGDELTRLAETTNATLDRLDRSLAQQRRFVADASHELRSPLAALRGSLEIPLRLPGEPLWRPLVTGALADVERLQRLTDDLLLLAAPARPDGTVDVAELVEEQVAERAYTAGGPAFTSLTSGPAPVAGSEQRVGRIIRNLLDNAARYAAGKVTAEVLTEAGTVVLTVRDDGPGIPEEDRERVFDRFVRLDDARGRATGGSGLGLAIVRELAGELGGSARVVPGGPGACLEVRLPRS